MLLSELGVLFVQFQVQIDTVMCRGCREPSHNLLVVIAACKHILIFWYLRDDLCAAELSCFR